MRDSVLLTVYNRPWRVLRNVLYGLRRNDLKDTEIIVVDDGSTTDYDTIHNYIVGYEIPVEWIRVNTVEDRPGTYNIDGYNNPAYAWNCAIEAAKADRVTMLASDCMVPPSALAHARRGAGKRVWHASVVDMDSASVYCGVQRAAPYGWMMTWDRGVIGDIREDEDFLQGIDFEDNDFSARLALAAGQVEIDLGLTVYHQSHPAIAYSDGGRGHDRNARVIRKKWGSPPWHGGDQEPLKVSFGQDDTKLILTVERR